MENISIKKAIKKRGATISQVAAHLGIGQPALSEQIKNDTLTLSRLQKIADYLKCSVSDLVSEDGEKPLVCPHCGKPINITLS